MKKGNQRKRKSLQQAINKKAWDEIIGDPFGWPEPIDGHYLALKNRSTVIIADTEEKSRSPVNDAKPNPIDFLIDVEKCVEDGLKSIGYSKEIFDNTYIIGLGDIFNTTERNSLEQVVGNIFVKRGIAPIQKYFTVIKN